jgi:scavenger receptor class B protein 1
MYKQNFSVTKTAAELMFEGYEDDMITMAKSFGSMGQVPFDRVGWFYKV